MRIKYLLADLAKWYLMKTLKKNKIELVITCDYWTYRLRDFKKEQSIKETLKMIK